MAVGIYPHGNHLHVGSHRVVYPDTKADLKLCDGTPTVEQIRKFLGDEIAQTPTGEFLLREAGKILPSGERKG